MFAPPSRSGFARKKFDGIPAAIAFARNVALSMMPVFDVFRIMPIGLGARAARNVWSVAFVHCVPVYDAGLPAWAAPTPLKNATSVGSGTVPGAPVKANEAPRPAGMFAAGLACAALNSFRKPFSLMLISL